MKKYFNKLITISLFNIMILIVSSCGVWSYDSGLSYQNPYDYDYNYSYTIYNRRPLQRPKPHRHYEKYKIDEHTNNRHFGNMNNRKSTNVNSNNYQQPRMLKK